MVVKRGGAFVKSSGVRGSAETKFLAVEMVTELVAKRTQEGAKGGNLLSNRSAGPYPDHTVRERVIPKQFGLPSPLPDAKGPRGQRPYLGRSHAVKRGCCVQKVCASPTDLITRAFAHRGMDNSCQL